MTPNADRSTESGIVAASEPSALYAVTVCVYIMFSANTMPWPDATTDFGLMSPVMRLTRVSFVVSAAGAGGSVVVVVGCRGRRARRQGIRWSPRASRRSRRRSSRRGTPSVRGRAPRRRRRARRLCESQGLHFLASISVTTKPRRRDDVRARRPHDIGVFRVVREQREYMADHVDPARCASRCC